MCPGSCHHFGHNRARVTVLDEQVSLEAFIEGPKGVNQVVLSNSACPIPQNRVHYEQRNDFAIEIAGGRLDRRKQGWMVEQAQIASKPEDAGHCTTVDAPARDCTVAVQGRDWVGSS